MFILSFLWPFVQKFWKPLVGLAVVIGAVLTIYFYGVRHEKVKEQQQEQQTVIERVEETQRVLTHEQNFRTKVAHDRTERPVNDDRDSCLLSAKNPSEDCKKFLQE